MDRCISYKWFMVENICESSFRFDLMIKRTNDYACYFRIPQISLLTRSSAEVTTEPTAFRAAQVYKPESPEIEMKYCHGCALTNEFKKKINAVSDVLFHLLGTVSGIVRRQTPFRNSITYFPF